ncbi:hypothetical protein V2A60_006471 [Cordyceps javanica]|uniref:Ankyrin repeat-containing domain-containing protein n=1 Tax=Cordyceps javanica TaxID=43265 RepID=A0A545W4U1_9HYPO|nr:Ankyrin repeat-containing domain-containing protein [Cordyceps javanica]TQW09019.1 Ankyrin repeat-containing domain protein [Cordyceps javanica]
MNRFRAKKRTKDDVSAPRPSMDSDTTGPFKLFSKKKLPDIDPKQNLDINTALPPTDDFRTSLLMTGLSARFSMLREQDDPHSKLGKASDDSVLFPKRQSRLMDFGYTSGLHDISEIESLQAASLTRINSSHGSENTDAVNIMDRSRPNDGNNLFGGRQKIFRIGAGVKTGNNGGMGGRVLYDEDVAKSAFQKWRQSERERASFEEKVDDTLELDTAFDYNKKRGTNSTTSSAASVGRFSTAATSVASGVPSAKEGQYAIPSSASTVERSFTRTRRLYEQGLTQDLQNQQSSALSRMDTLSKSHRNKPSPDGMQVPSPTATTFGDRIMERRTILTKASAPNLRSFTPPISGASPQTPQEAVPKFTTEPRANFGANPPLSPPISEADDHHPMLPIQPNDRGKATAMGVFSRPAQQYDDSKFAQRQQQMRKGRDASETRSQTGGRSSHDASRSRSSSMHRSLRDRIDATPSKFDRFGKKEYQSTSFSDDGDDVSGSTGYSNFTTPLGVQLSVERPNDEDHPAFRKSALPTPLSLSSRASDDNSSVGDKVELGSRLRDEPPEDSPTLGPGGNSGLSGMVRQHLRSHSNASSIYDATTQTPDIDSPQQSVSPNFKQQHNHARNTSWGLDDEEFAADGGTWTPTAKQTIPAARGEQDEFARHLADGARRVREKLTSYAEPDNEESSPPMPPPESTKELAAARNNALGILRTKSSRTSLFDRGRDREADSKAKSGKSPAPSTRKGSGESAPQELPMPLPKDENMHAGLKAFRQARRELQKMKEMEIQQRHGGSPPKSNPRVDRPAAHRTFSHDQSASPHYKQAGLSGNGQSASERDRSGSESSREGHERQRRIAPRGVSSSSDGRTKMSSHPNSPFSMMNNKRDISEPTYLPDSRFQPSRLHGATISTPNLRAPLGVPPLPPINPRRKNGLISPLFRNGEHVGYDNAEGAYDDSGDEQRRPLYRATSDQNAERSHHHPQAPSHRPPLPHGNMSSSSLPGGMI